MQTQTCDCTNTARPQLEILGVDACLDFIQETVKSQHCPSLSAGTRRVPSIGLRAQFLASLTHCIQRIEEISQVENEWKFRAKNRHLRHIQFCHLENSFCHSTLFSHSPPSYVKVSDLVLLLWFTLYFYLFTGFRCTIL